MNTKDIRTKIEELVDESTGKTLKETSAIKHIGIDSENDVVVLVIAIGRTGGKAENNLKRQLAKIVKIDLGFSGIKMQIEEARKIDSITNRNVRFIIIESGKGGVGKSTIAVNIAYALKNLKQNVAIIDADVYGSSVPRILEMIQEYPKVNEQGKIIPKEAFGMQVISTEFFIEGNKPVIWRGAMLNKMMNNFFYEVAWDKNLDFVVVDAPPGTGDVSLDLKNIIPTGEAIIVTTPHKAASKVAIKAGFASKSLNHQIIGVIENMSYFNNPVNNNKEYVFGQGGGLEVAKELGVELLAQIPLAHPIHHSGIYETDEEIGQIFDNIASFLLIKE